MTKGKLLAKVKLLKKSALRDAIQPLAADESVESFILLDNENATCTVLGVNDKGNTVDISAVARLTPPPSSDNIAIIIVDPPETMTFAMHAVGPLTDPGTSVGITAWATWNDASVGPYTFKLPVEVQANPNVAGVVIVPGEPTVSGP